MMVVLLYQASVLRASVAFAVTTLV